MTGRIPNQTRDLLQKLWKASRLVTFLIKNRKASHFENGFSTDDRRYSSIIVDLNEVNESFPLVKYIVSVIAF